MGTNILITCVMFPPSFSTATAVPQTTKPNTTTKMYKNNKWSPIIHDTVSRILVFPIIPITLIYARIIKCDSKSNIACNHRTVSNYCLIPKTLDIFVARWSLTFRCGFSMSFHAIAAEPFNAEDTVLKTGMIKYRTL